MDDFQEDDFQEDGDDFEEDPQQQGGYEGFAQKTLQAGKEYLPPIMEQYERRVTAPIRAGVGAVMDDPFGFGAGPKAYINQYGEDPTKAPTSGQLLGKAGINVPSYDIPTPFKKDLEGNRYNINTKEAVEGVAGAALDPGMYMSFGGAPMTGKAVGRGVEAFGKAAGEFAEERAAKQALGSGLANYRKAAGITPRGGTNIEQAQQNIRDLGRTVIDEKMMGGFSTTEGIGKKASKKFPAIQHEFEVVQSLVDETMPQGAVSGKNIAQKILEYASELPETENKKAMQNRLMAEAANFEKRPMMTFSEAQKFKNDFVFKEADPDAFVSNQDMMNTLNRIVSDEMEVGTDLAQKMATESGNEAAAKRIGLYRKLKDRYGPYKSVTTAATDRWVRDQSNNFFSPLNTIMGGATSAGAIGAGGDLSTAGILGALTTGGLGVLRTRGGAMASKSADLLRKIAVSPPLRKWAPKLAEYGQRGSSGLLLGHHLLMQSDPEYRNTFISEASKQGAQP